MISVTAVNYRLCSYGKSNKALTSSQKWSGGVISHMMACLLHWKSWKTRIFYCICEDKFISQFLLDYISAIVTYFPVNKTIDTYLHSKQEKIWENMTSFKQLKKWGLLALTAASFRPNACQKSTIFQKH